MGDRRDAGESLIEILVTLMILSIGIVALVAALTTNIMATVVNREQSQTESVLSSAAEYVKRLPSLPMACPGGSPQDVPAAQLERPAAYSVSYGPAKALATVPCSELVVVPVQVTGNGFSVSVDVVRRR